MSVIVSTPRIFPSRIADLGFSLTAPDAFDDPVKTLWFAALESFKLESPRGMAVAIPQSTGAAETPAPADTTAFPAGDGELENTFATHALAADGSSFDPDEPLNARMRNNGTGFVPNIIAQDHDARSATFAASALMASITVPCGWHIIDDSRRTLVFEPSGRTQISLNLIRHEGRGADAVLDELEAAARDEYPAPQFIRGDYQGIHFPGVQNVSDGEQPLEQCHMLVPSPRGDAFLRARVTTVPGQLTAAGNLAELILLSVQSLPSEKMEESDGPVWWREALARRAHRRRSRRGWHRQVCLVRAGMGRACSR